MSLVLRYYRRWQKQKRRRQAPLRMVIQSSCSGRIDATNAYGPMIVLYIPPVNIIVPVRKDV
jgi:hypothetical protein